ncbi:hypothetical protein EYZ11_001639 [Aspergillus tanneri]|uniref:Uncharacterized protein n=1 Tax=Aspergillus tanneri TaxID=1220188 RepID=A0A4S3JUA8_9EURO|nr:hypothetical protein EYZ11_001639 [Aspergillus tanneri]
MVTAADTVTPDASFTSPLLAIDEHRCGRPVGVINERAVKAKVGSIGVRSVVAIGPTRNQELQQSRGILNEYPNAPKEVAETPVSPVKGGTVTENGSEP